ncbi:MAG TPA: family 43 glycosylhydrolase, partial [Bacteroidales bacterium]|nr:family 43 glycosylhydrolase [Bacteroidales bacterium]
MERNKRKDLYRLFNIITLSFIFLVFSQSVLALQNHTGAHDPSTIVKDGDTYWIFTTGNGIYSMYSKDLIKWTAGKTPFPAGTFPSWIKEYVPDFQGHFWAPECVYMNGLYYLYYACSSWGSKNSCIGLATTKSLNPSSPDYEWKDLGMVVFSNNNSAANCIDPALFTDKDGKLWLSFGSYFGGIRFTELDSQKGKPLSSKLYAVASGNCEASYVILHGNYYYLFINRGSCCQGVNSTYHIQVGRSENPIGPFLDKYGNDLNAGGGTTILASQNNFIGPGCLGYYVEDGVEYTSYHYYDGEASGRPTLAIGTMEWDNKGWPVITNNWLDEGTYTIVNNNSNHVWATDQCLAGAGTSVVQSSYNKKNCQQWDLVQLGTGYYKIIAHSANRVVMVGDCATGSGAPLALGDYTGRKCEIWRIERTNNNTFV